MTHRLKWSRVVLSTFFAFFIVAGVGVSHAATVTVTSTADSGSGSLRDALTNASAGDTILLNVNGTITLAGDLEVAKSVTIIGNGRTTTIIDGNGATTNERVFTVLNTTPGTGLVLQDLKVTGGKAVSAPGGGIYVADEGWLVVRDCYITDNEALTGTYDGGGIYAHSTGSILIEGSTIARNQSDDDGGGVYAASNEGNLTITNSAFVNNETVNGSGGAFAADEVNVEVLNSTFEDNTSGSYGGAAYIYYGGFIFQDSTLDGNTSHDDGGAIYSEDAAGLLDNVTLTNNAAKDDYSGGALYTGYAMYIVDSTIDKNSAEDGAGGIYAAYDLTVEGSTISNNVTDSDDDGDEGVGGGVYTYDSANFLDTVISGNKANGSGYGGGGIYAEYDAVIDNVSFLNNWATDGAGGGVYHYGDGMMIRNSLFDGNKAMGSDGYGGGLYQGDDPVSVQNSTFVNNQSHESGGAIYQYEYSLALSHVTITGNATGSGDGGGIAMDYPTTMRNSIIYGNTDAGGEAPDCTSSDPTYFQLLGANILGDDTGCDFVGEVANVMDDDPLFATAGLADNDGMTQGDDGAFIGQTVALQSDSPAIDAAMDGAPTTDQRGKARIAGEADLGAYEYVAPATTPTPEATATPEAGNGGCAVSGTPGSKNGLWLLLGIVGIAIGVRRRYA